MKRIIQTRLFLFMALGLLSLMVVVGVVMTVGAKRQARTIIAERLRDLSMDVTEWRNSYRRTRETTDAAALAKTRMLARVIQYDPEILKNDTRLKELASVLNVDSLCVSDGEGVLIASSEPGFLGFHMDSTEQSGAFMPAEAAAKYTRSVPKAYIAKNGHDVTPAFIEYARPIVGELPHCEVI